jgi:F-type H+-transporting ATPase subunit alpha
LNLEEDNVGVALGPSTGIKEGSTAKRTQRIASLKAGEQMVGRGKHTWFSIDGKGPIVGLIRNAVRKKSPGVIFRQPVTEPLRAVDAMIPVGSEDNVSFIGDRQTGNQLFVLILSKKEFYDGETCILYI